MGVTLVQEDAMPIHIDSCSQLSQPTTDTVNTETSQTSPSRSASSLPHHDDLLSNKSLSPGTSQNFSYPDVDAQAIDALRALSQSNGSRSSSSTQRTSSPEKHPVTHHAGHKRTATGEFKSPGGETSQSPRRGHSRQSSTLSNGSTVVELSQQLRTRLSYAMVKVHNGWQANTIEEVETLASRHGSPRSAGANGNPRHSWNSPRTDESPRAQRQWSESASSEETSSSGKAPQLQSHATLQRSLAPAADFNPSHPKVRQAQGSSRGSNSVRPAVPSTPQRRRPQASFKQRTPSQTKAMEEEALETLLFMSSPGNSQYRSSAAASSSAIASQPQTSPLRAQFALTDKNASPGGLVQRSNRPHEPIVRRQRDDSDLDRVLDEMDSGSDGLGSAEADFLRKQGLGSLAAGA